MGPRLSSRGAQEHTLDFNPRFGLSPHPARFWSGQVHRLGGLLQQPPQRLGGRGVSLPLSSVCSQQLTAKRGVWILQAQNRWFWWPAFPLLSSDSRLYPKGVVVVVVVVVLLLLFSNQWGTETWHNIPCEGRWPPGSDQFTLGVLRSVLGDKLEPIRNQKPVIQMNAQLLPWLFSWARLWWEESIHHLNFCLMLEGLDLFCKVQWGGARLSGYKLQGNKFLWRKCFIRQCIPGKLTFLRRWWAPQALVFGWIWQHLNGNVLERDFNYQMVGYPGCPFKSPFNPKIPWMWWRGSLIWPLNLFIAILKIQIVFITYCFYRYFFKEMKNNLYLCSFKKIKMLLRLIKHVKFWPRLGDKGNFVTFWFHLSHWD